MRTLGILIILSTTMLTSALASELRQKYVGKSSCAPELNSPLGRYGIRLDKRKHAYLEAHVFPNITILTIVQRTSDSEQCGVVRDVVQSHQIDSSFVFECTNSKAPTAVVVGTWPSKYPQTFGPSDESWAVNLDDLRFVPLDAPVNCKAGNYSGFDEGEDLATWAKHRGKR